MEKFEDIYDHLQGLRERFEKTKTIFEESDKQLEEIRKRHEEEMLKLINAIEKHDDVIREYVEKKQHNNLGKLIEDIGHLIDEMFNMRLKLIEQKEELYKE